MRFASAALICLALSWGCDDDNADRLGSSNRAIVDGTPEAIGVLALLNDPSTTLEVLDDLVPLDARAARNLIAHRDGPDGVFGSSDDNRFDTIAEVDAVSYVGESALTRLLDYAIAEGWVPEGDDFFGRWDGVDFTVDEALRTLAFVNEASFELLDVELGLDRRAADAIVEAQPIPSMETLAHLYYVGFSALRILKEAASQAAENDPPDPPTPVDYSDQFNHDEAEEIPDGSNYGITTEVSVAGVPDTTVGVFLVVDVLHDAPEEIQLELTGPTGNSWEFELNDSGRYPIGAMVDPNGRWRLVVADWDSGNVGELHGWALEVSTDTAEVVMQERFALDLSWALFHWYGSYGDDVANMGGNTLEEARAAIRADAVEELDDPEDDPEGYEAASTLVLTHPDVVFPGGDTVWFGAYDRESGSLADVYTFE